VDGLCVAEAYLCFVARTSELLRRFACSTTDGAHSELLKRVPQKVRSRRETKALCWVSTCTYRRVWATVVIWRQRSTECTDEAAEQNCDMGRVLRGRMKQSRVGGRRGRELLCLSYLWTRVCKYVRARVSVSVGVVVEITFIAFAAASSN
jgi:hypothetical protein